MQFSKITINKNQQGVALLVVLLLVVSITIVAGSMLASQKITIRKSILLFEQNTINKKLEAGTYIAIEIIDADSKLNSFDSTEDVWAKEIPKQQTIDGYSIGVVIEDASSKFNINNLYHNGQVDEQSFLVFQRLLELLDLDTALAKVVLDWQDPDSEVYQDGGDESAVYQSGNGQSNSNSGMNNKKLANQPFISINQLLELPNVTSEMLDTLKPYITAVPYWLPLNANTVNETVLSALFESNDVEVQAILGRQGRLTSVDSLKEMDLFKEIKDKEKKADALKLLDVSSQAFDVLISVSNVDDTKYRYATMMVVKKKHTGNDGSLNQLTENTGDTLAVTTNDNQISAYNFRVWAFKPSSSYNRQ